MKAIKLRRWHEQTRFDLVIEKGQVVHFLEKLIPDFVCLFHIGCSTDSRPPSFEYTIKYGDLRVSRLVFSYRRTLLPGVFFKNNWFHDCTETRDLEAVADALSDPQNYSEEITLSYRGKDENYDGLGRTTSLRLLFKNNLLHRIIGFDEIQENFFKNNIKGFEESLLDLNCGRLKNEKNNCIHITGTKKWSYLFQRNEVDIYDLIKEIYNLFQSSAPQIGKRMATRKALFNKY